MNKSEIIAQAKIEKHLTNFIDKCMTQGLIHDDEVRGIIAWIFEQSPAARLLEMAEIAEEGSAAQQGDLLAAELNTWHFTDNDPAYTNQAARLMTIGWKIIRRNGKPVITIPKGEV